MYERNGQGNPLALATPTAGNTVSQLAAAPNIQAAAAPQPFYPPGTPVGQAPPQPIQPEPVQLVAVAAPAAPAPVAATPASVIAPASLAATIDEIEAACPNAPAEFVLQMQKQGATIQQSQTAFIQVLTQPAPVAAPVAVVAPTYVPAIGNQPVQAEPAATLPTINAPGGAMTFYKQQISAKKHMYLVAGMNAHDANLRAIGDVEVEQPGLREQAYGLVDVALPGTVPVVQGPAPYPQAPPQG